MDDLRQQQMEALEVAIPYCKKISNAISNIVIEFNGNRQPDTDEYYKGILNGLNWIFEVYNGTSGLINETGNVIDKEEVNRHIIKLNAANNACSDAMKAEALSAIKEFVDTFVKRASELFE